VQRWRIPKAAVLQGATYVGPIMQRSRETRRNDAGAVGIRAEPRWPARIHQFTAEPIAAEAGRRHVGPISNPMIGVLCQAAGAVVERNAATRTGIRSSAAVPLLRHTAKLKDSRRGGAFEESVFHSSARIRNLASKLRSRSFFRSGDWTPSGRRAQPEGSVRLTAASRVPGVRRSAAAAHTGRSGLINCRTTA